MQSRYGGDDSAHHSKTNLERQRDWGDPMDGAGPSGMRSPILHYPALTTSPGPITQHYPPPSSPGPKVAHYTPPISPGPKHYPYNPGPKVAHYSTPPTSPGPKHYPYNPGPKVAHYSTPPTRGPKRKQASHGRGTKRVKESVDFSEPTQLQHVMQLSVGHQVSSLVNNDFLVAYLKTSSSDFESVSAMMKLFDNTLFCDNDTLNKKAQTEVLPKFFEYGGFLEAVRYHLCCLPRRANDQVRGSSVLFIERLCKLFKLCLDSGDAVLATDVLPVDTLWGTTRQLSSQELRFQMLHEKAKEILQTRDEVRQIQYDTSESRELESDVVVLPTKEELQQRTLPADLQCNIISGLYSSELQYLDVQYRLLREDFIHPLRCAVHSIESEEEECQGLKVYSATIRGQAYSSYECSTFEISFQVQGKHFIRWDRSKRLQFGNLLCLMNENRDLILFATVAERKVEDLEKGLVTVDMRTKVDVMALPPVDYCMFESPGYYAAYAPILRHLRALQDNPGSLPFSKYIVEMSRNISHPKYIDGERYTLNLHTTVCDTDHDPGGQSPCSAVDVLDKESWKNLPMPALDDSQKAALRSALTQELSIIQGPPGTGKTYIGLKIVETLLRNRAAWDPQLTSAIVVVCYTNHALDQFLEGIIRQIGVNVDVKTKVRRVGGRSKSQLLKQYNINDFVLKYLRSRKIFGFWRRENSRIVEKLDTLSDLKKKKFDPSKLSVYTSFLGPDFRSMIICYTFVATARTEDVLEWLRLEKKPDCEVAFQNTAEADRNMQGEAVEDEMIEDYGAENIRNLFEKLSRVEELTDKRASEIAQLEREEIEPHVRFQLFKYCLLSTKDTLEESLKAGKEGEERYKEKRKLAMIRCLREADVIGLTTTMAAKENRLLSEMDGKILIVEEAAEILESHVVSSLSHKTQQVILIGDHKQLRPKTNDHILARDYHLDVSLFERLVRNGFPHVTLQCQHRMRPEISALVSSHIYDGALIDAPVTKSYPCVTGMQYNVFFMDHCEPETIDTDLTSKANVFEANFLAELCRYLLKQKTYTESQITVITPYTGQMFQLRESFSDIRDVKITPIDSYQGEENDIILVSLVRSEALGFVADHSRICVAMSRAKHGLYVIGNFKLFATRSRLWKALVGSVKSEGKFGTSLPLMCQGHGNITPVSTPDDFTFVSDGGCSSPCDSRLPCRHMCPLKCHPDHDELSHNEVECKEVCHRLCTKQVHRCKKRCCNCTRTGCGPCKVQVEQTIPKCGHRQLVPCPISVYEYICQETCSHILACDHRCSNKCGEKHTVECPELITRKCPKQHEGKAECYLTEEAHSRLCKAACGEPLMCGHPCQGTCGGCRQGRLHAPCREVCNRTLTCGHICTSPCAQNCPPCKQKCPVLCPHGPCGHRCHKPCLPCPHECPRQCDHQTCQMICGELCNCPPCDHPCPRRLACDHECIGLCGEECPDVCRICNKDDFNEMVPLIFGTEDLDDSPDMRIIMLDCGHKYEVQSLDKYYRQHNEENKVQWKQCLQCSQPVFKTNRYRDLVIRIKEDMNQIKKKELLLSPSEKRQLLDRLRETIDKSRLLTNRDQLLRQLDHYTDKELQNQYIIFHAEQSVKNFMENDKASLASEQPDIHSSMTLLNSQTDDFLRKLEMHRKRPLTEQVLYDIQAEQHRIQLLSVVLQMQFQLRLKRREIDQEKLDELLHNYEVRNGRSCLLKISPAEYDSTVQYLEALQKEHPEIFHSVLSQEERKMIIRTLDTKPGSWYKCPNEHVYNIGECGGAMQKSKCPECRATIGGGSHRLHSDNTHAGDFDDSRHAAWTTGENLQNFDLRDLQ